MADQVATTNSKLENHQAQLAVQIKERTRSLEDANQVLIETQEQLVRKKKLAVIGQMFGGFAHDIRNPLGAAKNAAFMLSKNLDTIGESEPKAKRYLAIISDQIERCNGIITDLLDSSQVKPIKLAPTRIEDVLFFACLTLGINRLMTEQPDLVSTRAIGILYQIPHGFPYRFVLLQAEPTHQ